MQFRRRRTDERASTNHNVTELSHDCNSPQHSTLQVLMIRVAWYSTVVVFNRCLKKKRQPRRCSSCAPQGPYAPTSHATRRRRHGRHVLNYRTCPKPIDEQPRKRDRRNPCGLAQKNASTSLRPPPHPLPHLSRPVLTHRYGPPKQTRGRSFPPRTNTRTFRPRSTTSTSPKRTASDTEAADDHAEHITATAERRGTIAGIAGTQTEPRDRRSDR